MLTLAQVVVQRHWGDVRAWSFGEFIIAIIILAAILAVLWIALRQFGIQIPAWVIHIGWILVVAFVAIAAIRFLLAM